MTNTVLKKQKIMIVTDTYQDRQTGQDKKRRRQVGELIQWSDGGISVEMWGPTGVQKLSVFDYQDDNQQTPQQQAPQQGYQQPQQQGGYQPPQQPAMNQQQPNPQGGFQQPQNQFNQNNDEPPY